MAGYLDYHQIIDVAKWAGADAVHPGYGFCAENWQFAQACADANLTFIGPPPEAMRQMGDKVLARKLADEAGLPIVPGSPVIEVEDEAQAKEWAARIGFPLLIKAKGGGGGRGMRRVDTEAELLAGLPGAFQLPLQPQSRCLRHLSTERLAQRPVVAHIAQVGVE